jgi:hypothetical protein
MNDRLWQNRRRRDTHWERGCLKTVGEDPHLSTVLFRDQAQYTVQPVQFRPFATLKREFVSLEVILDSHELTYIDLKFAIAVLVDIMELIVVDQAKNHEPWAEQLRTIKKLRTIADYKIGSPIGVVKQIEWDSVT